MKRRWIVWLLILVIAALLLGGCGVPREGVENWDEAVPDGWWQSFIVFPLAKSLLWLKGGLESRDFPYSWGFAIIIFTIVIKMIAFPLTMIQIRSMQAQKELQPRLQELQKKYGKNRDKMAQEQMKMYREAGVNPLSGCLPMVVQMPVLFGLYSALVALGKDLTNAPFFWIPDLGFPEFTRGLAWIPEKFNLGEYGTLAAYLVLPVLLMVSQFYMQRMTTAATPPGGEKQAGMMKQMTTMMTLMFGFFTLQVPAGLSLYWVTSNLLQMGQTYIANYMSGMNKAIAPAAPQAVAAAAAAAPAEVVATPAPAPDEVKGEQKRPPPRRRNRRNRKRR
ncbi:MAG: YidC/Oxa1 family membrane protein insertase [Caldilineaceae bacterium]|nr:YidC/Oxa1 family membrane protein insertase [Caldilineaceae bacterium]